MIKIKDVARFREEIIRQGYTFSAFSRKIETNRCALDHIFRRKSISPEKAKKAVEVLDIDFNEFFLISECPKEHYGNGTA